MGLIDIVKKGAMALGLAGTMAISGCVIDPPKNGQFYTKEEIQDQENRAAFLRGTGLLFGLAGVNATDALQATRLGVVSQAATLAATGQEQLAAAKASKSEVNQNVYINKEDKTINLEVNKNRKKIPIDSKLHRPSIPSRGYVTVASCNYCRDFDGNDVITYPEEYFGVKEDFGLNERVCISLHNNERRFPEVNYKLLNNRGEIVDEKSLKDSWFIEANYNMSEKEIAGLPESIKPKISQLEVGEYRAVWYSEGKLVCMWDFGIYNSPKIADSN